MALTTLTTGMSVAEHISALNNNMTFINKHGQPVVYRSDMFQWEIESAHRINGLGDFNLLNLKGADYINALNDAFISLAATDTITVVGATDVKTVGAIGDGATDDAAAINAALVAGNILIQDGVFRIEESIKIPSNRTVYLYNCKVVSKAGTYDNIFRNSDIDNGNVNINIIGMGCVEINGNAQYCDDEYATYNINTKWAAPPWHDGAYHYNSIFFCQVDGFKLSNLFLADLPHLYITCQKSSNGELYDLYHRRYRTTANQGYINCGHGSYNIDIWNIAGVCRDDYCCFYACNYGTSAYSGFDNWNIGDTYNISIENCHFLDPFGDAFGSLNCLIPGDGNKLYNIDMKNCYVDSGGTLIYTSFENYVDVLPAKTDFYNITMDNCEIANVYNKYAAFYFGMNQMNSSFTNMKYPLNVLRVNKTAATSDQSDNVTINGEQIG